jgi:hypothetical protein
MCIVEDVLHRGKSRDVWSYHAGTVGLFAGWMRAETLLHTLV